MILAFTMRSDVKFGVMCLIIIWNETQEERMDGHANQTQPDKNQCYQNLKLLRR